MRLAEFEIDGRTYRVGYNFNDLADAEPVCGCNLLEALDLSNVNASQLRGLLYAMVDGSDWMSKDPREALKQCGELIRMDTATKILRAIGEACALAVGEEYFEQWKAAMDAQAPAQQPGEATAAAAD